MERFSPGVVMLWALAGAEARAGRHENIEPAHLMLGLCKLCDLPLDQVLPADLPGVEDAVAALETEVEQVRSVFRSVGLDVTTFRRRLRGVLGIGEGALASQVIHRSPEARRIFKRAAELSSASGEEPRASHVLGALLELQDPPWARPLAEAHVEGADLVRALQLGRPAEAPQAPPEAEPTEQPAQPQPERPGTPSLPTLEKFGRDLTRLAAEGKLDPVVGRKAEMKRLAQVLMQKKKNSAVLVGDAGVGKTCIVEGLAQRIVRPDAPPALKGKRIIELSMASLVAGAKYRGEFEERLEMVLKEASSSKDLIIFIDEIHTMMGAGASGGSIDAANMFKPALSRGDIQCIGATTTGEYRQHIEKDPALQRRLQLIWVDEPTREEAIQILQGLRPKFEEHHGLQISEEAVIAAVEMSMRYLLEFRLPDKAIDLLDQACAQARLSTLSRRAGEPPPAELGAIGPEEIARVVAERCRIPVARLTEKESDRLLHMEEAIRKRVMGQEEAVTAVSETIRVARSGLKDPKKPVGVFLFLGATGTGKTELAKALTEFLFDDEDKLIAFDMSEYMEKHTVSRLIGAPPGYIGYEQEGQLTGKVRTNPYSVVLFDEVEKAHADIFDIFLQIFDEGRLTDAQGRRASFAEAVVIMTSNLGSQAVGGSKGPIGLGLKAQSDEGAEPSEREAYRTTIMEVVRSALRPELLNRVQQVVFFYPLGPDTVRLVIDKVLGRLNQRLAGRRIDVQLSDEAYELLMKRGFNAVYGAREMERAIDRLIVQPLGKALLEGQFEDGDTVTVDAAEDEMTFSPYRAERTKR